MYSAMRVEHHMDLFIYLFFCAGQYTAQEEPPLGASQVTRRSSRPPFTLLVKGTEVQKPRTQVKTKSTWRHFPRRACSLTTATSAVNVISACTDRS